MTRSRTEGQDLDRGPSFTYDEVAPGLYQGDFPDGDVDWDRFDDVISMTATAVPQVQLRADGLWLQLPILDDEMTDPVGVRNAALTAAERVGAGRRVLVHCWAGLNRSGVVTARALMAMGATATEAITAVREARGPYALSNPAFVEWLYEEAGEAVPASEGSPGRSRS
jgi:hypothetical protein